MGVFGNQILFYFVGCIQLILAAFVILRMRVRTALPTEDQESFVMQSGAMPAATNLDPRMEYVEAVMPLTAEVQTAVEIAETDPATAVRMAQTLVVEKPEQGVDIAAEVAKVEGVDPLRLYEVMLETVPEQILEVTSAMVQATPDLAYELVRQLAQSHPDEVVEVAAEIGRTLPDLRLDMAKIAVESAPESAVEVAEYYAQVMSEEIDAIRPADRDDDTSEQDAVDMVSQLSELAPEHTLDVATTIVEAVPDSAVSIASEVAGGLSVDAESEMIADEEQPVANTADIVWTAETEDEAQAEQLNQDAAELMTRLSEAAPDQAMDIGVAVVEALPETAVAVATEYANSISDRQSAEAETNAEGLDAEQEQGYTEIIAESVSTEGGESIEEDNAVASEAAELVSRLSEAVPEQAMDIGVAVVEALPETAVAVATEYANAISERQSEDDESHDEIGIVAQAEMETCASMEESHTSETSTEEGEQTANQEAAELVSRLADTVPEQAVDIGVAVVEALPESASDIVEALADSDQVQDSDLISDLDQKNKETE